VAAFFCFGNALGFPELVDHEVPLVAFDDALQLFVLVAGRDDEPIALVVGLVVLGKRQVDGLRALVLAALADDSELILGSFTQLLARALDLPIDRSVHGLVPRDALMSGIHGYTMKCPQRHRPTRPASREGQLVSFVVDGCADPFRGRARRMWA
jgi:hypothetical protein